MASRAPSGFRGNVQFRGGRVRGWVLGPGERTIEIEAIADDTGSTIWSGEASQLRNHAPFSNKNCGFDFPVGGQYIRSGAKIKLVEKDTFRELPFSPLVFEEEHERHVARLNQLSNWPLIHFQGTARRGDKVTARIIAVSGDNEPARLSVESANGIRPLTPSEVRPVGESRGSHHFWYAPAWPQTNFSVDVTEPLTNPLKDETGVPFIRLIVGSPGAGKSISATRDVGLVSPADVVIPPEADVRRVQAKGSIEQKFTASAFSQYRTYRHVYERYGNAGWFDIDKVLDWGCGCARVTQHLMRSLGDEKVYGADIDGENIDWCLANLPSRNFARCDLMPPLPYADGTFDYIVATSVLTHIQGRMIPSWLAELRRILKPGGIAAVTVGSETRVAFGSYELDRIAMLERDGIEDSVGNAQLHDVIEDKDYYRNVRMTKAYIREKWQEHFVLLDIHDHAIGVQDIVVGQKRP